MVLTAVTSCESFHTTLLSSPLARRQARSLAHVCARRVFAARPIIVAIIICPLVVVTGGADVINHSHNCECDPLPVVIPRNNGSPHRHPSDVSPRQKAPVNTGKGV